MSCPRCNIGQVRGGTGCLVCPFCRSIFDLGGNYWYTYGTSFELEARFSTEVPKGTSLNQFGLFLTLGGNYEPEDN